MIVLKNSNCPNCKIILDGASNDEGGEPKKDDISICIYCQYVLVFNEDLTLREMTEEEWEDLPVELKIKITIERNLLKMIQHHADSTSTIH